MVEPVGQQMMIEQVEPQQLDFPTSLNLKKIGSQMSRPRHQKGWLEKKRGHWVAHWYAYVRLEDGKEIRRERERKLETTAKQKRWQAEEELKKLVAGDPATFTARPDSRVSLGWFYQYRFLPLVEARWRPSTHCSQPYVIKRHIISAFGELRLDKLNRFDIQTWLDGLGGTLSRGMLLKIRNLFRVICKETVEQEYLVKNPVDGVKIHGGKPKSNRFLSLEEIARLDQNLPHRERIVFRCLVLLGLRPGELFARRWKDWSGDRLMIADAVYRGKLGDTKTEGSRGFVWIPKMIQQDLGIYRLESKQDGPEDFMFSGRPGIPMDCHNYLRRVLKPACSSLGVPAVTHQCLRRTCSTYLLPHGSIKDTQAHLRHASAKTTLEFYAQEVPESVRQAVEDMSVRLFPAETKGRVN